jgi:hypothetical protein
MNEWNDIKMSQKDWYWTTYTTLLTNPFKDISFAYPDYDDAYVCSELRIENYLYWKGITVW